MTSRHFWQVLIPGISLTPNIKLDRFRSRENGVKVKCLDLYTNLALNLNKI